MSSPLGGIFLTHTVDSGNADKRKQSTTKAKDSSAEYRRQNGFLNKRFTGKNVQ